LLPNKAEKMVTTIHDINHIVNPNQFGRIKFLLAKMMVSACIHKSNSIITVSQFSKSELLRVFPFALNKIEAFPLAVSEDFNVFTPIEGEFKNYLLAVGNVKPHKNLKQALEVFEQLPISDLKFVIVGKRDGFKTGYGIQLEPIISKLGGRVSFTGEVSKNELLNYYANARGFVFPSLYEGFGLPLLEAMKFNLPILASNKASIPEVLSPKAMFFDPNVKGDFFEKLQLFLATYPIGSSIDYSDHLAKFSWEKTAKQHIDLFHKILRN
jgi:glycosyltransferase involved in cell wall biosynthesis